MSGRELPWFEVETREGARVEGRMVVDAEVVARRHWCPSDAPRAGALLADGVEVFGDPISCAALSIHRVHGGEAERLASYHIRSAVVQLQSELLTGAFDASRMGWDVDAIVVWLRTRASASAARAAAGGDEGDPSPGPSL